LASFFGFFHLLNMILNAVPIRFDSDETGVAVFWFFSIIIWWFLNLPPTILLLSVSLSRYAKWARKYQVACGVTVIASAGFTILFSIAVLTLTWPDGFSFSIAQWLIYASVFLAGIVYMASGISQLRHLSPAYTDELYMLHVRHKLEEQMTSWRIRSFESGGHGRKGKA
jgi:hypothetical protein